jgi:hypothetical protein
LGDVSVDGEWKIDFSVSEQGYTRGLFMNTEMNLEVPQKAQNFLIVWQLSAS